MNYISRKDGFYCCESCGCRLVPGEQVECADCSKPTEGHHEPEEVEAESVLGNFDDL